MIIKQKSMVVSFAILAFSILSVIAFYPLGDPYGKEYIVLATCFLVFLLGHCWLFMHYHIYIFEPIFLVSGLYMFIFFIDPMVNILAGETDAMGYNIMYKCVRATGIFMISYCFFLFGYYRKAKKSTNKLQKTPKVLTWNQSKVEMTAFIIWLVAFALGCIELVAQGMSVSYFLTLGFGGEIDNLYNESVLGFLGNFKYSMITAWVYLFVCNKKSPRTWICGLLTLDYYILGGFRHSLFVVIFAPIVYLYVSKKKTPKLRVILILLGVAILVMGLVQFMRSGMRSDTDIDWSLFDSNIFVESIQGNFDIYKTFYGMVDAIPRHLDYQWGEATIISVITMVVPRAIWAGKTVSPIITNLGLFCGPLAADSGYAMPYISEFYLDWGIPGCCLGFWLLGEGLKKLKSIYDRPNPDRHALILYAVYFPALLQVILRGYSPYYVYLLFFYALPVIIIRRLMMEWK